jgi:hypothetical protein
MNKLPKIRTADLVEQEAGTELLIYNTKTNKTYLLNETSKNVFSACTRQSGYDELKRRYHYSDDLIHFALDELRANGLIESETSAHFAGLLRREVIKRVGLGSLAALPVIAALTAPTSANAASNCSDPNGFNVPSGCPVGSSFLASGSCGSSSDATKSSNCDVLYGGNCQSGDAVYQQNSCVNEGGNYRISCVCA